MALHHDIIAGLMNAGILTLLSVSASRAQPKPLGDGSLLFRYPRMLRGLAAIFAFGFPLAITALIFIIPPKDPVEDVTAMLGMYGLAAALGYPLWRETTRFAVIATPRGLECRSPWREAQFIAWEDFEELSFSSLYQWFIIRARYGQTFRVHVWVGGVSDFLARCESHLDHADLAGAKTGYAMVGRAYPGP